MKGGLQWKTARGSKSWNLITAGQRGGGEGRAGPEMRLTEKFLFSGEEVEVARKWDSRRMGVRRDLSCSGFWLPPYC